MPNEVTTKQSLADWQIAIVDLFVNLATSLGFQKSIGQIYGLLYASEDPLCLDDIVTMLGISKGSASQGLRTLRNLGAVKLVFIQGERRDHFEPEIRLKQLVSGLISNQIVPQLANGNERIEYIQKLWSTQKSQNKVPKRRIDKLKNWSKKTQRFLPLINKMIGEN